MSQDQAVGPAMHSFVADHLITVKGVLVRTVPGESRSERWQPRQGFRRRRADLGTV